MQSVIVQTSPNQPPSRPKMALSLVGSLAAPPLGLILGIWLLLKGRKSKQKQLSLWGLAVILAAIAGAIGYAIYFSVRTVSPPLGSPVIRLTDYSQSDITLCLDGKQTITITKDKPYSFGATESQPSDDLTPTLANYFLENKGGDFTLLDGPGAGKHHIDKRQCKAP